MTALSARIESKEGNHVDQPERGILEQSLGEPRVYAMTVGAKPTKNSPAAKRRSPISRAEGEQRLIDAALQLVRSRPFSEVSVRDIARLADVNHGFVHTWFGSKNDLLARVAQTLMENLSEDARQSTDPNAAMNPFDERIVLLVRLVIWLHLEGYDFTSDINFIIVETLRHRYATVEGLTPEDSEGAALIAASIGVAVGAFTPIIEGTNVDIGKVMPMWRHILGLLARHPQQ